jgi:hypothetical protein
MLAILFCAILTFTSCAPGVPTSQFVQFSQDEAQVLAQQLKAELPLFPASRLADTPDIKWDLAFGGYTPDGASVIGVPTSDPDQAVLASIRNGTVEQFKLVSKKDISSNKHLIAEIDIKTQKITYSAFNSDDNGEIYGVTSELFGTAQTQKAGKRQSVQQVWDWVIRQDRATQAAVALQFQFQADFQPFSGTCNIPANLIAARDAAKNRSDNAIYELETKSLARNGARLELSAANIAYNLALIAMFVAGGKVAAFCNSTTVGFAWPACAAAIGEAGIALAAAYATTLIKDAAEKGLEVANREYETARRARIEAGHALNAAESAIYNYCN